MTYAFDLTPEEHGKVRIAAALATDHRWMSDEEKLRDLRPEPQCKTSWKEYGFTVYRGAQGEAVPFNCGLRRHLVVFGPEHVHPSTNADWLRVIGRVPNRANHYPGREG